MIVDIFNINKKYKTIYADPPWMETGGGKIKRGADAHYDLMKTKDIMRLPIQNICENNAHLGLLKANGIPYQLVRPQKWKKEYSITANKNTSIEVCKRLFPNVSLLPTERCRKDHDGLAEALLMAEFARRKLCRTDGGKGGETV